MATTVKVEHSGLKKIVVPASPTKQEIDTRIPPKAKPLFKEVSVNGIVIPEVDILQEAQNHPAQTPGEALLEAARSLVIRELLWQEAKNKNLVPDNEDSTREDSVGEDNAGEDNSRQTKLDAAISALLESEIKTPEASEDDCKAFYDRDPSRFSTETIWQVRHILIGANPKDKKAFDQAREKAYVILEQVKKNPHEFATIAKDISSCPSAAQGGNLGQITRGSTVPEFENALKKTKKTGLLMQPVESRYGYHIVEINQIIPGKILPLEMVKEKIAAWLEASSWSKAVQQYIAILAGKSHITGIDLKPGEGPLVQ
ncbi:peptidylprolyl isomerase [Bartonella apis]|uniref:Parvulin-like PPIase n=1 Tax=Bartonella apis TaxID=1686310 RepID=A0A1R0FCK3_9HYPH|nr:peptidylprolyl isomerase [Bartonella apis]OLY44695.1 peptidyl-prolyl cis-trans isomerase C [Bartonella apis]